MTKFLWQFTVEVDSDINPTTFVAEALDPLLDHEHVRSVSLYQKPAKIREEAGEDTTE